MTDKKLPTKIIEKWRGYALDRKEESIKFTEFFVKAILDVHPNTDEEKAHRILVKTEAGCLVTNSLSGTTHLNIEVRVASSQVPL